jgi:hypothetical protein
MPDLRPGNRGIGVSVAVGTFRAERGNRVKRTVVRRLVAFDATLSTAIRIEPGANVEAGHIVRNAAPAEDSGTGVYAMEFEFAGLTLRCPLVDFQARTQSSHRPGVQETPARETATMS